MKLVKTHHFILVAIETGGCWNDLDIEFVTESGRRVTWVARAVRDFQRTHNLLQEETWLRFGTLSKPNVHSFFSPLA